MNDPIRTLNEMTAQLNAQSSRWLNDILSEHPEKRLPRWRPLSWRYWFHLHCWKRGLFDGMSFPKSIGYEMETLPNRKWELRLLWECTGCPAFYITMHVVPMEQEQ